MPARYSVRARGSLSGLALPLPATDELRMNIYLLGVMGVWGYMLLTNTGGLWPLVVMGVLIYLSNRHNSTGGKNV